MVQEFQISTALVFSLYVPDGYSHKEIAEILNHCTITNQIWLESE
jgi:transposase